MSLLLFNAAFCSYVVGLIHSLVSFVTKRDIFYRVAISAIVLGFVFHTGFLLGEGIVRGHFPMTDLREALAFFAWTVTLCFLIAYFRYSFQALGLFLLPLVAALMLGTVLINASPVPIYFESYWIIIHILFVFLAYGMLFVVFITGFLYLFQETELKNKTPQTFFYRLPALGVLDELFVKFLVAGFVLMTVGLLAGIIWAEQVSMSGWQIDPKVLAAGLTWAIYLILIYLRLTAGVRGKKAALLSMAGFLSALFALLGSNIFGGLHAF